MGRVGVWDSLVHIRGAGAARHGTTGGCGSGLTAFWLLQMLQVGKGVVGSTGLGGALGMLLVSFLGGHPQRFGIHGDCDMQNVHQ